jgi:hypothetical protein
MGFLTADLPSLVRQLRIGRLDLFGRLDSGDTILMSWFATSPHDQ